LEKEKKISEKMRFTVEDEKVFLIGDIDGHEGVEVFLK
jgi:hypothetical protein